VKRDVRPENKKMKKICHITLIIGLLASTAGCVTAPARQPEQTIKAMERAFQAGDADSAISLYYLKDAASRNTLAAQLSPMQMAGFRNEWRLEILATQVTNGYAAVVVRPWVQGKPTGKPDIAPMFLINTTNGWLLSPNIQTPFDFGYLVGINGEGRAELEGLYRWSREIRNQFANGVQR
jgi:hypothetical protein